MKQTDWKIVYTSYSEETKRAINLITKEAGRNIIRQQGEYCLYVLPCIKEGGELPKNAFFISCYDDSSEIPKYVKREEVPEEGFLVKVVENPNDPEGRFVILTAHKKLELFYNLEALIGGNKLRGLNRINQKLKLGKLKVTTCYVVIGRFRLV